MAREKIDSFCRTRSSREGRPFVDRSVCGHAARTFCRMEIVDPGTGRGGVWRWRPGIPRRAQALCVESRRQSCFSRGRSSIRPRSSKIFESARLFVYPSLAERGESFGLAPLEAMAHGCAVIVSNLDCFQDFIRDGETGFVFDHRAETPAKAFGRRSRNAIADPILLANVADAGYRKSADYSVSRVADQFLHDFSSLTGKSDA